MCIFRSSISANFGFPFFCSPLTFLRTCGPTLFGKQTHQKASRINPHDRSFFSHLLLQSTDLNTGTILFACLPCRPPKLRAKENHHFRKKTVPLRTRLWKLSFISNNLEIDCIRPFIVTNNLSRNLYFTGIWNSETRSIFYFLGHLEMIEKIVFEFINRQMYPLCWGLFIDVAWCSQLWMVQWTEWIYTYAVEICIHRVWFWHRFTSGSLFFSRVYSCENSRGRGRCCESVGCSAPSRNSRGHTTTREVLGFYDLLTLVRVYSATAARRPHGANQKCGHRASAIYIPPWWGNERKKNHVHIEFGCARISNARAVRSKEEMNVERSINIVN